MRKLPWFVLALLASVHSTAGASGIFLIGQSRHVQSSAFVTNPEGFESDSQSFFAPDEGDFDVTASVTAEVTDATATAIGSQISTIDAQAIHATGNLQNSAEVLVADAIGYASGASNVALRFMVQNTTTYRLVGFVEAFGEGYTTVQFSRPYLTVVFESATEEHIDLDLSGQIEPGTYDFNITTSGALNAVLGEPAQSTAGYDLALVFGNATGAPVVPASIGAFPNPFSEETRLVLGDGVERVRVIDLAGRVVRTLQGSSSLVWDGRDDHGRAMANGVYWIRADGVKSEPVRVVRLR